MAIPTPLNFFQGTLNAALNSSDATATVVVDKKFQRNDDSFYDLEDQITTTDVTSIELTVKHKNNKKVELMRVSSVAKAGTTTDGRQIYTLTLELNGATTLRGLANSYDGTTSTANVITDNIITQFPKNSPCLIAVNSGIFERLNVTFADTTSEETAVLGETITERKLVAIDSTDGLLYKFNTANSTHEYVGILKTGEGGVITDTKTYVNTRGTASGFTGLTPGVLQFASTSTAGDLTEVSNNFPIGSTNAAGDSVNPLILVTVTEFTDSDFRIIGSSDASKKAAFEVDGFTTSTTRTFTLPDSNGEVITDASADIPDSIMRVVGSSDATKKVAWEVDGLTTGTTRTITVPDANVDLGDVGASKLLFQAHRTSNQSFAGAGAFATIAFNGETFDPDGVHSNGVFTAPAAGTYSFQVQLETAPLTNGSFDVQPVFESTAILTTIYPQTSFASVEGQWLQFGVNLAADDTVEIKAKKTGANGVNVLGAGASTSVRASWWGYRIS